MRFFSKRKQKMMDSSGERSVKKIVELSVEEMRGIQGASSESNDYLYDSYVIRNQSSLALNKRFLP
ncbi:MULTISPECIES: hypothetical protein [Bacillus]|uniref:Uncharacterized protein n=5 Tax=Bacillus cereus group TaxID=86661 RepID=A0A9X5ABW9_BACTU|nr:MULTISPECIES: hypothetical protein [Bacillus]AHX21065.1 hypothetical protein CY96_24710 [Bacillus bombysepticus str. Wang]KAB7655513.1 hypothetical protein GBN78_14265 [Bacillus sp. B2-WWTP-C-10-Post-4]MDJ0280700.1 hypothetical protein [Bacillus bombysepticus]CEV41993.1 Uncharacterised protein [Streptococcus pneumoniae]ANE88161.1 hypothetical protein DA68_21575 [Bacillus cereus]